jgi:hypothetical protein
MIIATGVIIIEAPENITAGLGQDNLTLTCRVRNATSLFMEIDDLLSGFDDDEDFNERGIIYSEATMNGTRILHARMELRKENNNSRVACIGRAESDGEPYASEFAYVTILGMLFHNGVHICTVSTDGIEP